MFRLKRLKKAVATSSLALYLLNPFFSYPVKFDTSLRDPFRNVYKEKQMLLALKSKISEYNIKTLYAVLIDLKEKQGYVFDINKGQLIFSFPVAIGKNGVSVVKGTKTTPYGLHIAKLSSGGKKYYKKRISRKEPTITTAFIQLFGIEKFNKNSFIREIGMHGTTLRTSVANRMNASKGCIRLFDEHIVVVLDYLEKNGGELPVYLVRDVPTTTLKADLNPQKHHQ